MSEMTRPMHPGTAIRRTDFPILSATMAATVRSTGVIQIPAGASLIRMFWASNSNPSLLTFDEAPSQTGAFVQLKQSSNNSTIAAVKPFGNSTPVAGCALVPDLACARFVKVISSKVNGNKRNFYFVCNG